MKKLASTKVDTTLLKSSRNLGVTKQSKREILSQALNETQAGINVKRNSELLFTSREENPGCSEASEDTTEEDAGSGSKMLAQVTTPVLGSGLKRSLEIGTDGNPLVKKRKRSKHALSLPAYQTQCATSWDGFSSEAEWDVSRSSVASSTSKDGTKSESTSTDEESIDEEDGDKRKARSSAFKAWATSQVNEALDFTPTATAENIGTTAATLFDDMKGLGSSHNTTTRDAVASQNMQFKPRAPDTDPLPPELGITSRHPDRKVYGLTINRAVDVEEARLRLPIVAEEQRIMEAIHNNPTVVIAGETGSGKTTQVPQFLYEAGYGKKDGPYPGLIGITQPRRVAAMSMAKRVGDELGGEHSPKIAYQIRFDSSVGGNTAVKFMTDGILVREIANDFVLSRYSVIIVDEAHERSANTDILIGLLSRIVDLRESMSKEDHKVKPLKLIIMSATLRIQDFLSNRVLFRSGPPPLIQIEGRQYPVTIHFARRTQSDYAEQAFQKVCRGHKMLPPGAMLVFLTGQDEISALARRLKHSLGDNNVRTHPEESSNSDDDDSEEFNVPDSGPSNKALGVHVLSLYAQMQTKDQLSVFQPPPAGTRLIVLATNVAETSLTIPGIRYVFDCGRAKDKNYDKVSGVQSFDVGWISKASADQRTGRAGRTGPGHCYRLYSSAIYERDFEEHAEPEILRMPVEGVVLQLKSMDLHNVVNFPFPTPPDRLGLAMAEKLLTNLGALSNDSRIVALGRRLSEYPLSPRYAKMLDIGHQHGCIAFTIILVAALTTPNIFISENHLGLAASKEHQLYTTENRLADEAQLKRRSDLNHAQHQFGKLSRTSDALKAFTALQGYLKTTSKDQYCSDMFLLPKQMSEASHLVDQLTTVIRKNHPLRLSDTSAQLSTPTKTQIAALQQFAAAGFLDEIAILASESPSPPYISRNPKRAIDVPYLPLFPIDNGQRRTDADIRDVAVYIHPSSVLARLSVREMPKYIVYSHLQRGVPSSVEVAKKPKTRMHALTTVNEVVLASLARGTPLLEYGKPIGKVEEGFGPSGKTRTCFVNVNLVGEKGTMGWPLTAQKVVQRRDPRGEWIVEQVLG